MKIKSGSQTVKIGFTKSEAVEALGISRPTLDRLVRRGVLKPSRATRRPIFSVWELERFLRDTTSGRGEARECPSDAHNRQAMGSDGDGMGESQGTKSSSVEGK